MNECIQKGYLIILINTYHRSPLIRQTKRISFGMSVILFAWSAAKFQSSNVPERIIQYNININLQLIRNDDVCNKLIFQKITYSINELQQLHAKPLLLQLASCGYSYLPILGHSVIGLPAKWNFHGSSSPIRLQPY